MEIVKEIFTRNVVHRLILVLVSIIVFYAAYHFVRKYIRKLASGKIQPVTLQMIERGVRYSFNVIVVLYVFDLFGFNLKGILGAAGIAGVAIGFAAQTSFANIISGFFVLSDHSLKVGDFVTIDAISGTVVSTDLLSVKIQTPDNHMVRVPNETINKSNLINVTFNPIRRLTIKVGVAYKSDLEAVRVTLQEIALSCPMVLTDPAPVIIFDEFAASSVNVILGVWFKKEDFLAVKNAMYMSIHRVFRERGIEIAFPQLDLHRKT